MGHAGVKPYVTFADYVAGEQAGDVKHEWSLREYVLVSQNEPLIEVFRRPASGHGPWDCEAGRSGETVTVHGADVFVDHVYGAAGKT